MYGYTIMYNKVGKTKECDKRRQVMLSEAQVISVLEEAGRTDAGAFSADVGQTQQ